MSKYFCNKCFSLTYSLRFIYKKNWSKPKGLPQYCRKCNLIQPQKNCIGGLSKMKKHRGGD